MQLRNGQMMMSGSKVLVCLIFFGVFFCTITVQAATDSDGDGLSDDQEQLYGTNPQNTDSDGDGYSDTEEIKNGFSPLIAEAKTLDAADTDKDGLLDWQEIWFHTKVDAADTDGDGHTDYDEVMYGFSPTEVTTAASLSREIDVDLTKQMLAYAVDGVKLKKFPVSTGLPTMPTPPGKFSILKKVPVIRYQGVGYDYKGVKWNLQFKPGYYLHTAYWHNDFGKRVRSHGCVNMREADVAVLYQYVDLGIPVLITGQTPKHLYVGK